MVRSGSNTGQSDVGFDILSEHILTSSIVGYVVSKTSAIKNVD